MSDFERAEAALAERLKGEIIDDRAGEGWARADGGDEIKIWVDRCPGFDRYGVYAVKYIAQTNQRWPVTHVGRLDENRQIAWARAGGPGEFAQTPPLLIIPGPLFRAFQAAFA